MTAGGRVQFTDSKKGPTTQSKIFEASTCTVDLHVQLKQGSKSFILPHAYQERWERAQNLSTRYSLVFKTVVLKRNNKGVFDQQTEQLTRVKKGLLHN
jgi:hypothetical protein